MKPIYTYVVYVTQDYENWFNRFKNTIDKTLNEEGSWNTHFKYDSENPDIIYTLASQEEIVNHLTNKEKELDIYGNPVNLSVTFYGRTPIEIMIDAENFINGVPISKLGKKEYRKYVINHETGHALGYDHLPCNIETKRCPLMYQMTKGVPGGFSPSYKVSKEDYKAKKLL